jgi:hypothetical protein
VQERSSNGREQDEHDDHSEKDPNTKTETLARGEAVDVTQIRNAQPTAAARVLEETGTAVAALVQREPDGGTTPRTRPDGLGATGA